MRVLIIDDEKTIRDATSLALSAAGFEVESVESGRVALPRLRTTAFDLAFLDLRMPGEDGLEILREIRGFAPNLPVIVFTAYASVETAVAAMRDGAFDYLPKPFTPEQLRRAIGRVAASRRSVLGRPDHTTTATGSAPEGEFESNDPSVRHACEVLRQAAPTAASILILGESGTGKTVAARTVHARSAAAEGPFVTVRGGAGFSPESLESELFGHVRGAFPGADGDGDGKVAAASGGTLFVDEIGDMPRSVQRKFLRLLQDREYHRVGEHETRVADIRIIAATNHDLLADVEAGSFREDLYYRLNVISVSLPPLRRRPGDIRPLAGHFLRFFRRETGRSLDGFTAEASAWLEAYSWPGNLRELRNLIERAVLLAPGPSITAEDLSSAVTPAPDSRHVTIGAPVPLARVERAHIERVLDACPTQEEAARILDIDPATLYRKRRRWATEDRA